MKAFSLSVAQPMNMIMTGKFKAPDEHWKHLTRHLTDYELIVMSEGTLHMGSNQDHIPLKSGEFLLLPPNTYQYGYKSAYCSFYWLHFTDHQAGISLLEPDQGPPPYSAQSIIIPHKGVLKNPEKVMVLMKQLHDSQRSYQEPTLNNYMTTTILCEIYNQIYLPQQANARESKQEQIYNDILDYVKWTIHQPIRVAEIARHFGYNEKYLSHFFTTLSGMSLKQYMLQEKMEIAKFILSDSNSSIQEIAESLGYQDAHNFMKVFKKVTGFTPTQYRNTYSKRLLYYK